MSDDCLARLAVLENELKALHKQFDQALSERDKALIIAAKNIADKMEAMNQIREQLATQKASFVSRDEFSLLKDQMPRMITRSEHDTLISQLNTAQQSLERNIRTVEDANESNHTRITNRLTGLEAKFWIGGTGLVLVLTAIQLVLEFSYRH